MVRVLLVHGMGRTPFAMAPLAARLRRFVERRRGRGPYVAVGHSLGTVLLRAVHPLLDRPPEAYFFVAPPVEACLLARRLSRFWPYRMATGEMGQQLADPAFMRALPRPDRPTRVYVGTAGPVGRFSPFGAEPNDGVLTAAEAAYPGAPTTLVGQLHTFAMNAPEVAADVVRFAAEHQPGDAGDASRRGGRMHTS